MKTPHSSTNLMSLLAKAHSHKARHEYEDAIEFYDKILTVDPDHLEAIFHKSISLERLNKIEESERLVRKGLEKMPSAPGLLYVLGQNLKRQERFDEAIDILEKIEETDQTDPQLITLKYFELGQNYDRKEMYDEAYDAFANAQYHRKRAFTLRGTLADKQIFLDLVELYKGPLSGLADKPAPPDSETNGPHFLVGFPRSGTTLLHQMLSAHSKIDLIEEIPMINNIHKNIVGELPDKIADERIIKARQAYRKKALSCFDPAPPGIYIDKLPLNVIYLSLVLWLFPNAKIIVALRHPFDCILSCLMQHFNSNSAIESLTSLQDAVSLYSEVMGIYLALKDKHPGRFIEMRYEDVIEDPEDNLKKICEFLGLEWEESILNYRDQISRQQIATPSYQQVVQPLYKRARYRWKNYKKHFEVFEEQIEPFINEFGYQEKK